MKTFRTPAEVLSRWSMHQMPKSANREKIIECRRRAVGKLLAEVAEFYNQVVDVYRREVERK